MAVTPPKPLLLQPASVGARARTRELIDAVDAACARLRHGDDAEALHDFRVALRRLRSFVRAYKNHLPIGKHLRLAIGAVTGDTGSARDAEVALVWLRANHRHLDPRAQPGYYWMLGRLQGRLSGDQGAKVESAVAAWEELRTELSRRLKKPAGKHTNAPDFAGASAALILEQVRDVERRLNQWQASDDPALAHRTRIAGKRLRYMVETFKDSELAREGVAWLKQLQDDLGELHDRQVMIEELEQTADRAAQSVTSSGDPQPDATHAGLAALLRLARQQEQQLHRKVRNRHLSQCSERLAPLHRLVDELQALSAGQV